MGIANIINTSGGGGGGGSEIITHLVNSVDGAGLRLANQGYISCTHVSANKFGTNDFSVEFVLSQETNAVNADIFISNLNGSNQAVDAAVIRWDVVSNDNIQLVFTNSSAAETAYNFGYDPAPDLNEPTHYLVSADRSGNAVLYRNGAEIASISIAASGSANVGNSGQPTVIGSPVNNFGVKGNVYRLRTYSKALSSDEAKNVFDRADVPTALVSNLLLDLDCAYANPTQSTVIQDRGPNNQDGTLNGTITQTNVIKQLNSVSARIGTSTLQPADGELMVDKIDVRNGNVRVIGGNQVQLLNAADDTNADIINSGGTGVAQLGLRVAGSEKITISSTGNVTVNGPAGTNFNDATSLGLEVTSAGHQRMKVHSTSTTGHQVAYDLETGNGGSNYTGRVRLSGGGVLSLQNPIDSDRLTIDANGQVGLSATPNLGSSNANNTILTLKGKAAAYGGIIEMSNHGTNGNGQTLGAISYFDPAYAVTKNAEIEVLRESNNDDAKMVFKTKPTGGTLADRLTISSTGLATFSGGIVTSEKGIMSGSVVIADEGVTTITPTRSGGFLEVHANTDDGTTGLYPLSNYSTKIFFDSGSSPANAKITTAIGADVDLTTSDVTGTTGTNGKVTIATLSNAIKIENQKGGAVKFFYTITC